MGVGVSGHATSSLSSSEGVEWFGALSSAMMTPSPPFSLLSDGSFAFVGLSLLILTGLPSRPLLVFTGLTLRLALAPLRRNMPEPGLSVGGVLLNILLPSLLST